MSNAERVSRPADSFLVIARLSAPLIIALLANAAMAFIDTMLMGMLGVEELAGGGLGTAVYSFVYLICIGVLVAVSTTVAYSRGKQDSHAMHQYLLAGQVVAVVLAVICGLGLWYCVPLLGLLDLPQTSLMYTEDYLQSVVWALWPALAFMVLRNFAMAMGKSGAILRISLITAACNYPVSYALMTGWGVLPELGLAGIGYGTALMSVFMFIAFCLDIYRKEIFRPFKIWKNWSYFRWQTVAELFRLGIPIGLALAMEAGLFSMAAILAGTLGEVELAAHQIALQCVTLSFMFPLGISQALSIMVGERLGQKKVAEIGMMTRRAMGLGMGCSLTAAMIFVFVPEFLVDIFLMHSGDQSVDEVYSVSIKLLFVAAFFQVVDGLQVITMGALRGLQLSMGPTLLTVMGYWGVGFPAAFWLMSSWSVMGIWSGMGLGLGVTSTMLLIMLYLFLKRSHTSIFTTQ